MVAFPNIKINIGLNVVQKRADGFHNIESIFYPVPFCDILEILTSKTLKFTSSGIEIPGDPDHNLCLKAYYLLEEDFDLPPVYIHLHKIVPIGAGLGGGSSDAAFTLTMLNEKFELGLNHHALEGYAQQLGSDCAFFIENKPKYCYHKGDEFTDTNLDLSDYKIVIVYPNIHISTPEAYAGIKPSTPDLNVKSLISRPFEDWKELLVNDFEKTVCNKYPIISEIKEEMYNRGAAYASMSGSGSAVYGLFKETPDLDLFKNKYFVWVQP